MNPEYVVAVLVALLGGGFLGSLVQGLFLRRKLGADYAEVIAKSATGLLQPLTERVEELQTELRQERMKVRVLMAELEDTRDEMRSLKAELVKARKHREAEAERGAGEQGQPGGDL